jgi:hypothetical protein
MKIHSDENLFIIELASRNANGGRLALRYSRRHLTQRALMKRPLLLALPLLLSVSAKADEYFAFWFDGVSEAQSS